MFSIFSSILSRNMCKPCPKLCNTKIYPLEVWISPIIFLISFYRQFRQFFHISEPTLWKLFFLMLNYCFVFKAPRYLETCVNCVTNWKITNIYPKLLGYDKINLDISLIKLEKSEGEKVNGAGRILILFFTNNHLGLAFFGGVM